MPLAPIYPYLDHALEAGIGPGGRPYHSEYYGYYLRHPYPYSGDGYGPLNHPIPGDYGAANQLNAQEAGRGGLPGISAMIAPGNGRLTSSVAVT